MIKYWKVVGFIFLLGLSGCKNDSDVGITTSENRENTQIVTESKDSSNAEKKSWEYDKDTPMKFDDLYGTSPTLTISDEEFVKYSAEFSGRLDTTDEEMKELISTLREYIINKQFNIYFNEVYDFASKHNIPDTPIARDLILYYLDAPSAKDIYTYKNNEDWENFIICLERIRRPDTFVSCISDTGYSYKLSKAEDSYVISMDYYLSQQETPVILGKNDVLYKDVINMVDYPKTIYKFRLDSNEKEEPLYAYVVSCQDLRCHLVQVTDWKDMLPELEENTSEIIHMQDYDEGAWE